MNIIVACLLFIHGVIHTIGFIKPDTIKQNSKIASGSLRRWEAWLWLFTSIILIVSSVLRGIDNIWWWVPALTGIILSQVLIITKWEKAKAGTIINVLLLFSVSIAVSEYYLRINTMREMQLTRSNATAQPVKYLSRAAISELPICVQRWIVNSGALSQPVPRFVMLKQKGYMRIKPDGQWMKCEAEQFFNTQDHSFAWYAHVKSNSWLYFRGIDRFEDSKGSMRILLYSLVPVVNSSNYKIDQGALLRYLAEMVWFPACAVNSNITWQSVDDNAACARMTYKGNTLSGIFRFDGYGRFLSFEAQRYLGGDNDSRLETWYIPANRWERMKGILVPVSGDAIWKLKTGQFNYFKWEITALEYE